MRARGRAAVVVLVAAGHGAVLAYLALSHVYPPMAEPPLMTVTLVTPTAAPPPPRGAPPSPSRARAAAGPVPRPVAPLTAEGAPGPPTAGGPIVRGDLWTAPFEPGRAPPRGRRFVDRSRETCEREWKKLGYPGPARCDRVLAEQPGGGYQADRDAKNSEFAQEVKRKGEIQRYRDTYVDETYPGLACAVYHKC